jgi:ABC-type bacteriocin/lantibiotic exporter with double-glycine peptidase domain
MTEPVAPAEASPDPRDPTPSGPESGRPLPKSLFRYAWDDYKLQQVAVCLVSALVFPLTMVPLELQRRIINEALGGRDLQLLFILGGIYMATVVVQGALKFGMQLIRGAITENAIRRLRRKIYRSNADEDGVSHGAAVSMMAAETERVGGFVGESLSVPVLQAGILVSVLGYMLYVQPLVATVSLVFFIPRLIATPLVQRAVNRRAGQRIQMIRQLGEQTVEDGDDEHGFEHRLNAVYRNRMSIYRLKFGLKAFNNLMNHLAPISVLVFGGYLALEGQTTIGVLVAFVSGFERMADPSRQLINFYRQASETRIKYRMLAERIR